MEKTGGVSNPGGSKQVNLKKAFNLSIRSLLTACSKEEFCQAFPNFASVEQDRLHRLFIQVITSLHQNIEDEFESLCLETQAGKILDTVEQHIEEQSLDPLLSEKSNIVALGQALSGGKRNEIVYLKDLLDKAEEEKRMLRDRLELLNKNNEDLSGTAAKVHKLWAGIRSYGADTP